MYPNNYKEIIATIDPSLWKKVEPSFTSGDYAAAILLAFKEVEVRVRKSGGYSKQDIGARLMRKVFHPETGKLTNKSATMAERQAMGDLFAGAIGLFKNPVSHRDFAITSEQARDIVLVANCLVRMIG